MEFTPWPKTPRLNRDIVVTEKIDGTNAAIIIEPCSHEDRGVGSIATLMGSDNHFYNIGAQSRKRLITLPAGDNFGFGAWVLRNRQALVDTLGVGAHFGEWWGSGVQRGYGETKGVKHFSLFNVDRYADVDLEFEDGSRVRPVPTLYRGPFSQDEITLAVEHLRLMGSEASTGSFFPAEGVVVFHSASRQVYKVMLENDDTPKGGDR